MRYKIGEKVTFEHDEYDYYCNTDLIFIGTITACGTIKSYNEEYKTYEVVTDRGITYTIDENEIIHSETEHKVNKLKERITEQKLKIADCSIKIRDVLRNGHPTEIEKSREEYGRLNEEWFDLISEYDNIENEYIMLTKKQ